jgi:hypothetical protein
MKELHVEVFGGLCNRLRVYISACHLAERYGRKLLLSWRSTEDCGARFRDLFTNSIAEVDPRPASPAPWTGTSPDNVLQAVRSSEPVVWLRECGWLVPDADRPKTIPHFEALCPVEAVVEGVDALAQRLTRPAIGVHVRRGDFAEHLPQRYHIDLPPLERYFEYLDDWRGTIFLATDGGAAVEGEFRERYGHRVVIHPKRSPGRNTPEAIQDALVDVYLLQRCQAVIGTRYSSFSGLAWIMSGAPHAKITDRKASHLARFKFSCKLVVSRFRQAVLPWRKSPRRRSA